MNSATDGLPRFRSTRYPASATYLQVFEDKLARCWDSLELPAPEQSAAISLLSELCTPWGHAPIGWPRYRSNISIEGMPLELSAAWEDDEVELRLTIESLGAPPTRHSCQEAGKALTRRLADYPGVAVEHCLGIEDLFTSASPNGLFPLWHGVAWRAGAEPLFKTYLNPGVRGENTTAATMAEATSRLGVAAAWQNLNDTTGYPGEPIGLALDLTTRASARIKVYLRNDAADAAEIDRRACAASGHIPGTFERALRRITGHRGPGWRKTPATCFTLNPSAETPTSATLYVPLIPDFDDDARALDRVKRFMRDDGTAPEPYESFLHAISDVPLHASHAQNFVSYRAQDHGRSRFASYVAPGIYG